MIDPLEHIPLLKTVAAGFQGRGLDFDDLVSEGFIALDAAAKGYTPESNFKWSNYATIAIRNRLLNATSKTGVWASRSTLEYEVEGRDDSQGEDGPPDVSRYLEVLTPQERKVIELRYGIGHEPHSITETGRAVGRCPASVCSIQKAAIAKLRSAHGSESRRVPA